MQLVPENLFIASSAHIKAGLDRLSKEFPKESFDTITSEDFATQLDVFVRRFRHYRRAVFYTYDFDISRTIVWHGIVWWLARVGTMLDGSGRRRTASLLRLIFEDTPQLLSEPLQLPYLFSRILRDLSRIDSKRPCRYPQELSIAYLRTDHWFGVKSGGSVTHIAGVANSFRDMGIPLFFLSSDKLELIDECRTPLVRIRPGKHIRNIADAPQLAYNLKVIAEGNAVIARQKPTLIYQRYSQYNYAGAYLATKWNIPFVLEFNGSEVWVARHWGTPLRFQGWAERIESANLKAADAIIVVSEPMKLGLVKQGVTAEKILVNPNGVDIDRFNPEKLAGERDRLRHMYSLDDKIVVAFIGTFGKWHGAEVLAKAVRPVIQKNRKVRFLFIGDGVTKGAAVDIIEKDGVGDYAIFTGSIPQDLGPSYLSAADILVSPHVPNPDGSPFFGSPTKLFEYMAMSRGIVASDLNQIGEILTHGETALLVRPGSIPELAESILELASNPQKCAQLGAAARAQVSARHTWRRHTERILAHLTQTLR
jgi:glycosyltransferase involved in cell wall biosynthesis